MNCICCKRWGKCPRKGIGQPIDIYGVIDCGNFTKKYITPAQYKERMGREYPDNAPVGVFCIKADLGLAVFNVNTFDIMKYSVYKSHRINPSNTERVYDFERVYCAFGDLVPPDEGVVKHET